MQVLVVNAGSSSLKLRLLDDHDNIAHSADLPAGPDGFDITCLAGILQGWDKPDMVGHRIVHGGTSFTGPVRINDAVRAQLRDLTDLAPLHQPKSLAALDAVTAQLPDVAAVASFDTAFHTTIPAAAAVLALDVYTHRLVGDIGAMSAATQSVDVLVFTGGVGEHSSTVRRRAAQRLGFLGVAIAIDRNDTVQDDGDITAVGGPCGPQ